MSIIDKIENVIASIFARNRNKEAKVEEAKPIDDTKKDHVPPICTPNALDAGQYATNVMMGEDSKGVIGIRGFGTYAQKTGHLKGIE